MEEVKQYRHKIATDTVSLLEDDAKSESMEDEYTGNQMFFEIIRLCPTEREKFIALGLFCDFTKKEIAFMLRVDPSRITRNDQELQKKLAHLARK